MNSSINENNNSQINVKTDKSNNIIIVFIVAFFYCLLVSGNGNPFLANFIAAPIFGLILSIIPNLFYKNWTKTWMWTTIIIVVLSSLGQLLAS